MNVTTTMTVDSIRANKDWANGDASKVLVTLGKREAKDSQRMYRTVCALILRNPQMLEESTDQKAFMDMFSDVFYQSLDPELQKEVPIASKGSNKDKPAFRSWDVTKPRWQYAGYIYNAIEAQGIDSVFPGNKPLPSLSDIRKMQAGAKETPVETIKRCLELATKKMSDIGTEDRMIIDATMGELQIAWGKVVASHVQQASTGTDG